MLYYMIPWLYNVELIDPHVECRSERTPLSLSAKIAESNALSRRVLKGEGWGSQQATEMVLNNLMYLTVKVSGLASSFECVYFSHFFSLEMNTGI